MHFTSAVRTLGRNDRRLVQRDSFLLFMVAYILLIAVGIRFAVPWLAGLLDEQTGFDLAPYYPVIAGWLMAVLGPQIAGTVFGFLLLEEKDNNTLEALMVTPLSLNTFLLYRVLVATGLGIAMAIVTLLIMGLVDIPVWQLIPIAVVAGLFAPILMLFFAAMADNKVEGFALLKITGVVGLIPIAAWFVPEPWQYLAGLFPPYWAAKALWIAEAGGSSWPVALLAGVITSGIVLWLLMRRFNETAYD